MGAGKRSLFLLTPSGSADPKSSFQPSPCRQRRDFPSLLLQPLTTSLLSFSWCIYERADIYCKPLPLPATMDAKQQRRVCGTLSTVQGDS